MADEEYVDIKEASKYGVPIVFIIGLRGRGLFKTDDEHNSQIKLSTLQELQRILKKLRIHLMDEEEVCQKLGKKRFQKLVATGQLKPHYYHDLNFFPREEVEKYIAAPTPEKPPRSASPAKKPNPIVVEVITRAEITDNLMTIRQAALSRHINPTTFYGWVVCKQLLPVVKIRNRQQRCCLVRKADVEALPANPLFQRLLTRLLTRTR